MTPNQQDTSARALKFHTMRDTLPLHRYHPDQELQPVYVVSGKEHAALITGHGQPGARRWHVAWCGPASDQAGLEAAVRGHAGPGQVVLRLGRALLYPTAERMAGLLGTGPVDASVPWILGQSARGREQAAAARQARAAAQGLA